MMALSGGAAEGLERMREYLKDPRTYDKELRGEGVRTLDALAAELEFWMVAADAEKAALVRAEARAVAAAEERDAARDALREAASLLDALHRGWEHHVPSEVAAAIRRKA